MFRGSLPARVGDQGDNDRQEAAVLRPGHRTPTRVLIVGAGAGHRPNHV